MPAAALDTKHGSGAINNDSTAMALNTQSATLNQPEGMQQAATPQTTHNMNENVEWSLSESSPGQPAMARPEPVIQEQSCRPPDASGARRHRPPAVAGRG